MKAKNKTVRDEDRRGTAEALAQATTEQRLVWATHRINRARYERGVREERRTRELVSQLKMRCSHADYDHRDDERERYTAQEQGARTRARNRRVDRHLKRSGEVEVLRAIEGAKLADMNDEKHAMREILEFTKYALTGIGWCVEHALEELNDDRHPIRQMKGATEYAEAYDEALTTVIAQGFEKLDGFKHNAREIRAMLLRDDEAQEHMDVVRREMQQKLDGVTA